MRSFQNTKGAISIFLCIVIVTMIAFASVLVDSSRVRFADSQLQQAANISANSMLADYNDTLKDLFGLFATSTDTEDLKDQFENYLNKCIGSGLDLETGGTDYLNFLNMEIINIKIDPVSDLGDNEILKNQILQYMKYRAPATLSAGILDKFNMFKSFSSQSETVSKKIEVDKKYSELDEVLTSLSKDISNVNNFSTANQKPLFIELYNSYRENLVQAVKAIQDTDKSKKTLESINKKLGSYKNSNPDKKIKDLSNKIKKSVDSLNTDEQTKEESLEDLKNKFLKSFNAIKDSNSFKKNSAAALSTLDELIQFDPSYKTICLDVQKNIQYIGLLYDKIFYTAQIKDNENKYSGLIKTAKDNKIRMISCINKSIDYNSSAISDISTTLQKNKDIKSGLDTIIEGLKNDTSEFSLTIKNDAVSKEQSIDGEALTDIKNKLNNNINALNKIKGYLGNKNEDSIAKNPSNIDTALLDKSINYGQIYSEYRRYFGGCNGKRLNFSYSAVRKGSYSGEDPRKAAKEAYNGQDKSSSDTKNADLEKLHSSDEKHTGPFSDSNYDDLIVKALVNDSLAANSTQNVSGIMDSCANSLDSSKNQTDAMQGFNTFSSIFSGLEDTLLESRDKLYIDEYVMGNFKNACSDIFHEKDLSLADKSKRITFFTKNQVEYVINGSKSAQANLSSAKARILLIRFVLNTIYLYSDPGRRTEAFLAAEAICNVFQFATPIVHTMIMLAWSMAESIYDLRMLMDGNKVPLLKSKTTWAMGLSGLKNALVRQTKDSALEAVDYGAQTLQESLQKCTETITEQINSRITAAIDSAWTPLYKYIDQRAQGINPDFNTLKELSRSAQQLTGNSNLDDIYKSAYEKALKEVDNKYMSISGAANDKLQEIRKNLDKSKDNLKKTIKSALKNKIDTAVNSAKEAISNKIKDSADKFIVQDTNKMTSEKTSLSSIMALDYRDYLRILLLLVDDNTKLNRIRDLIDMDMIENTGQQSFRLKNCFSDFRIQTSINLKYIFPQYIKLLTSSGKNFESAEITNILYKGY